MNEAYWDGVAEDYEGQVLSVFDHDNEGAVLERIRAAARPDARAADLGCGVGKFAKAMAGMFAHVEACDLSARAVAETQSRCADQKNVTCRQLNLARDPVPFAPVDFVLCVNVLMMPSLNVRMQAWRAVTNQMVRGGTLLLVVPSLESMHYEVFRALEARLHEGRSCAEAIQGSIPQTGSVLDLHQGIHPLDGLRTKHYLREELERMFETNECDVVEVAKVEYPWSSVYEDTLVEADAPLPWDWLVVARRR